MYSAIQYCVCIQGQVSFIPLCHKASLLSKNHHTSHITESLCALGDMFLHYHKQKHSSLLFQSIIILMHQILTRGANLDQYTTENSPQQMLYFLLFG